VKWQSSLVNEVGCSESRQQFLQLTCCPARFFQPFWPQSPKCPTKFRILDMLWPPSSFEFYCNFDIAGIFSVVFSLPGSKKLEGLLSWLGSDWLMCCDVIHSSCVWPVTRHWAVTWVPICELELFQCSILIIMRDDLKKNCTIIGAYYLLPVFVQQAKFPCVWLDLPGK